VGLSVEPSRAAFRLAAEPDTVNDAELLVSVVKLKPVVDANVSIPWATDSESVLTPAAALVKLTALLLPVEKTSDRFSLFDPVAGAVIAPGLAASTVSVTLLEFETLSVGSGTNTPSESAPVEPVVGACVSPLKAAFRLAIAPVAVNEGEPLVPAVKLDPLVGPGVSLPCETDSESESELLPAAASITEIPLPLPVEKTSEMFSVSGIVPGALIVGAARALTVGDALVELDSVSPV
jgi:hypothetical protein